MKSRFDLVKLGFALGILVPLITFAAIYSIRYDAIPFREYVDFLIQVKAFPKLLSLTVIPNLLMFFIFIWTDHLYAARGVLAATILDALIVLVLKFVL